MSTEYNELLSKRLSVLKNLRKRRKILELKLRLQKPEFLRWCWWKFAKFQNNLKWKKPRGKDNPVRLALKGYPPKASTGYGTPNEIRNLHPSGLKPVVIASAKDMESLDPMQHIIYIASAVGLKKRLELIKLAKSKGFKVANER
ncbi:50S ribosomal protein L32e [Ignisphaera sp. 4213-co]|uniref:Large ribosomal subunit protein eL32 n=1 Tax=Ignisphaera cupida TaxID=3050454 RepID=A0ABD4Z4L8_9CREN|nr:50S ribosomal protein L32e [Ignisphaera sp. 4213-co]MDK6027942.1 50S ribosomal protein L32e [Ignisphaera sp. 4213-co]